MEDYWNDPPDDEEVEHPATEKIGEYLEENGVTDAVRAAVLIMVQDLVNDLVRALEADCPTCLHREAEEAIAERKLPGLSSLEFLKGLNP